MVHTPLNPPTPVHLLCLESTSPQEETVAIARLQISTNAEKLRKRNVGVKVTQRNPGACAQNLLPVPAFPLSPANGPCFIKITRRKERGNIYFLGKVKENNNPWEFLRVARRLQKAGAVRKRIALFYCPWGLFLSVEGAVDFLRPAGKPCSISDTVPPGRDSGEGGLFLGCRTACNWESPSENFVAVCQSGGR